MSGLTLACAILAFTFFVAAELQIQSQMNIQIQLGQAYHQDIPVIFSNYQQSTLKSFKNINLNYTQNLDICQIRVKDDGKLAETDRLNYSTNGFKYDRDSIIYRLKDIQQSKVVIDSIVFQDKIVALFPPSEVVVYSINNIEADIKQLAKFNLYQKDQELLQALFVQANEHLLLVTGQHVFQVATNGTLSTLTGYEAVNCSITDAVILDNKLYIGMGQKGLSVYKIDSSFKQLTLETTTQFLYTQDKQSISFDVDQFQIQLTQRQASPTSKYIFVLDYTEGLFQVALDSIKKNITITAKPRLLASSCRNLVIFWSSIYLTCPELVQISIKSYSVNMTKEISFNTQSMRLEKDRLFLFGTQNFALFDIYGRTLAEYSLPYQSQLSLIYQGYLMAFGRESIISHEILPQKEELFCYSNNPEKVGQYSGFIQTAGICKEVHGKMNVTKKSWEIYCLVDYPIRIKLKEPVKFSVKLEISIALFWIIGILIALGAVKLKNVLLKRKYSELTDQEQGFKDKSRKNQFEKSQADSQINSLQQSKNKKKTAYSQNSLG